MCEQKTTFQQMCLQQINNIQNNYVNFSSEIYLNVKCEFHQRLLTANDALSRVTQTELMVSN